MIQAHPAAVLSAIALIAVCLLFYRSFRGSCINCKKARGSKNDIRTFKERKEDER